MIEDFRLLWLHDSGIIVRNQALDYHASPEFYT